MTREEEIKQASEIIRGNQYGPTLARQGFEEGAKWADAHPFWVDIGHELPTGFSLSVVYDRRRGVCLAYYNGNNIWIGHNGETYSEVAFWKQLPDIPEGGSPWV